MKNLPHKQCKALIGLTRKNLVQSFTRRSRGNVKWVECGKIMSHDGEYWTCSSGHKLREQ